MAKPLGVKSRIIREAIHKHPDKGNTELAAFLTDSQDRLDDKLEFAAQDVAAQRQALKKAGEDAPVAARSTAPRAAAPETAAPVTAPAPQASASPVDLIDQTLSLAQQCGGFEQLKRLVERLEGMKK